MVLRSIDGELSHIRQRLSVGPHHSAAIQQELAAAVVRICARAYPGAVMVTLGRPVAASCARAQLLSVKTSTVHGAYSSLGAVHIIPGLDNSIQIQSKFNLE